MEETLGAGEVQEAGTSPQGFLSSEQIGHRSHGGTGLLSAAAFSATPILRIAAITEVAKGPSDGGRGGAIVLRRNQDPFCDTSNGIITNVIIFDPDLPFQSQWVTCKYIFTENYLLTNDS